MPSQRSRIAFVRFAALLGGLLCVGLSGEATTFPSGVGMPALGPSGAVVAVAYRPGPGPAGSSEAGSARLAAADRGGVWVGPARGPLAPVHRARGVRDLLFSRDGALWIAGDDGLHAWRPGAASEALGIGPGATEIHRVREVGDRWLAAGVDGIHARGAEGRWSRVELGLPSGPVTALAAAPTGPGASGAGVRIGAVVDGVAHWVTWAPGDLVGEGPRAAEIERIGTPGEGPRGAADVWIADDASEAWTLLRDGCLVGSSRACAPIPPGSEAHRLFHVGGRWWVTTERGLWVAEAPAGPWERAGAPLGGLESYDVDGAEGALFIGTERGLLRAEAPGAGMPSDGAPGAIATGDATQPASSEAAGSPAAGWVAAAGSGLPPGWMAGAVSDLPAALPPGWMAGAVSDLPAALLAERRDPPLEAVRRAALAHLDLDAARLRAWRRAPERSGWFPTVALRLDHDRDVARREDHDESFVSGGLHSLFDRQDDRSSGFGASLTFAWDLGDVVYHPESVDVSRETRELVELRDDILDEIHQLYFERRRVLLELLALPAGRPLDAARLRLRADELAAGIDAWTGGWFSRHALRMAP